ncbi:BRO family protein [Leuconostoc citreum]|uniref:BRO family protein n=1 Tax=Leuconostoc citreum TaxID=33964 RepID=UPI0025A1331C|nr:ORF6C domain-containing protein [Leuconostoc citreum]MDM7641058.1 ORF6C domain-containing protein [Leuconostoc citreum]
MNEVKVFDNLKVKEENGQILFDAETAAIGLGLTETKKKVLYVRWRTLKNYLSQEVAKGDFITEPQFYKLAIKANNETAEKFQDWVTSEVLPAIRKTGSYTAKPMSELEQIALIAKGTTQLSERIEKVDSKLDNLIDNQALNATDYGSVNRAVNHRVYAYASIHHIPKSKVGPLFKDLGNQIKQVANVGNRSRIKSKDYDMVIQFIDNWEPSSATKTIIEQTSLDVRETA